MQGLLLIIIPRLQLSYNNFIIIICNQKPFQPFSWLIYYGIKQIIELNYPYITFKGLKASNEQQDNGTGILHQDDFHRIH